MLYCKNQINNITEGVSARVVLRVPGSASRAGIAPSILFDVPAATVAVTEDVVVLAVAVT